MGPTMNELAEAPAQEESLEQRYNKMVHDLVCKNHWAPRKARRFLDCMARREAKKSHKLGKTMPKVDVSDITEEMAPLLGVELAEAV
jgi:polyhydroxyalkanoate synthesis regulator phasin